MMCITMPFDQHSVQIFHFEFLMPGLISYSLKSHANDNYAASSEEID